MFSAKLPNSPQKVRHFCISMKKFDKTSQVQIFYNTTPQINVYDGNLVLFLIANALLGISTKGLKIEKITNENPSEIWLQKLSCVQKISTYLLAQRYKPAELIKLNNSCLSQMHALNKLMDSKTQLPSISLAERKPTFAKTVEPAKEFKLAATTPASEFEIRTNEARIFTHQRVNCEDRSQRLELAKVLAGYPGKRIHDIKVIHLIDTENGEFSKDPISREMEINALRYKAAAGILNMIPQDFSDTLAVINEIDPFKKIEELEVQIRLRKSALREIEIAQADISRHRAKKVRDMHRLQLQGSQTQADSTQTHFPFLAPKPSR